MELEDLYLKEKEEREMEECSFRPQVSEMSNALINCEVPIYERNKQWQY